MPKLIPFSLFEQQSVVQNLPNDDEVTHVCAWHASGFLCASTSGRVRAMQLTTPLSSSSSLSSSSASSASSFVTVHEFQCATACGVEQLLFCAPRFALTRERETETSSIRIARVYGHWTTAASSSSCVDLRTPSSITALAACAQRESRFAVATANDVYLYECVLDARTDALQLVRLVAVANAIVQPVTQLALCTPLLAYGSGDDVFMLRIALRRDEPRTSGAAASDASAESALRDDALQVTETPLSQVCAFDQTGMPTACVPAAASIQLGRSFETAARARLPRADSVRSAAASTVVGPVSCLAHRCVVDDQASAESQLAAAPQLLLYRRFEQPQEHGESAVHSLQFIVDWHLPREFDDDAQGAAFDADRSIMSPLTGLLSPDRLASPRSPLSHASDSDADSGAQADATGVANSQMLAGVRLMLSTAFDGFVYDTATVTLLSTYSYPNPTHCAVAGRYFLFTLTSSGLETWMLRRAAQRSDGTPIVPPEPLLVSLQKFVGLRQAVALESQVILRVSAAASDMAPDGNVRSKSRTRSLSAASSLANSGVLELSWAINVLQLTPSESLAETQLYEAAARYEEVDAILQQRLLDEACALLRERLACVVGRGALSLSDHVLATDLRARLRTARRRLAEKRTAVGALGAASALWAASDASVETAFTALEGKWHTGEAESGAPLPAQRAKPLTRYLNKVLFDGLFARDRAFANAAERHAALANSILQHYARYESESLPLVLLESWLAGYDAAFALKLMRVINARSANVRPVADGRNAAQSLSKRSPALLSHMRRFATAVLAVDSGESDEAALLLDAIPPWAIVELFAVNSKLFQRDVQRRRGEDGVVGETAGELLLRLKPWCLVDVARLLIRSAKVGLASGAVELNAVAELGDTFFGLLASRGTDATALIQQACVLEALLQVHAADRVAATRLARCYVALLAVLNTLPSIGLLGSMQKRAAVDDTALGAFVMHEFSSTAVAAPLPRWIEMWDAAASGEV